MRVFLGARFSSIRIGRLLLHPSPQTHPHPRTLAARHVAGDGTLGMLTRSQRVVETVETMLGGPVLHYHSKNLVKYPEEGGVWNWHQDYGYW